MAKKKQLTEQEILDNAVKKQYIWEKEIKNVENDFVEFVDWTVETYNQEQQSYLITEKPADATKLQDLMLKNVVPKILDILDKHNIRKWDLQAILEVVVESYNHTWHLAVAKAFWTYREWVHFESLIWDIRVSDIKKMIS